MKSANTLMALSAVLWAGNELAGTDDCKRHDSPHNPPTNISPAGYGFLVLMTVQEILFDT
jgi:hypothetical protein